MRFQMRLTHNAACAHASLFSTFPKHAEHFCTRKGPLRFSECQTDS